MDRSAAQRLQRVGISFGLLTLLASVCPIASSAEPTVEALPPWLSHSPRANPFDPPTTAGVPGADAAKSLATLEPLPPVPIWGPGVRLAGPADEFQLILDGGRMHGAMSLAGTTKVLVTLNGERLTLSTGDTVRINNLTLTVLDVAPEAVVLSAEDGTLVGMLPRDPNSGLQVDRSGSRLAIRSISEPAD